MADKGKGGVYGIKSFKMTNAVANAFANFTNAVSINAIVKDSLTYNDGESSENDIEVEDMDNSYASLPSALATKGFTIQTYDMNEATYKHLCGYADGTGDNTGYLVETPGFQLPNQAVQIITKEFSDFPSKTFEWANMQCKVTRSGTIGKSGFPNFNITFKQQALTNTEGKEIAGARWKYTDTKPSQQ